jgi:hypothetical protein
MMGFWSLLFFIAMGCCIFFGYRTIKRLGMANDTFARRQQIRAYLIMCVICTIGGAGLGLQSYFLDKIDASPYWYFIVLTCYRLCELTLFVGCAIYVWYGTTHWKKTSSDSMSRTTRGTTSVAARFSPRPEPHLPNNDSSEETKTTEEDVPEQQNEGRDEWS